MTSGTQDRQVTLWYYQRGRPHRVVCESAEAAKVLHATGCPARDGHVGVGQAAILRGGRTDLQLNDNGTSLAHDVALEVCDTASRHEWVPATKETCVYFRVEG